MSGRILICTCICATLLIGGMDAVAGSVDPIAAIDIVGCFEWQCHGATTYFIPVNQGFIVDGSGSYDPDGGPVGITEWEFFLIDDTCSEYPYVQQYCFDYAGDFGDGKAVYGGYSTPGSRIVRIYVTDDDSQQWNVYDRTDWSGERQIIAFDFYLDGCSGGLIRLNDDDDDDDDENGTIDFYDGETEEEDGELEEVSLYFSPGWVTVGKIRVSTTTARLKVWADEDKSELIASHNSPKYFDPGDLNPAKTVWLEGAGSAGATGLDMDYVWPDGEG